MPAESRPFLTNIYVALLLVGFYYLAYRYPLQINSALTSPTYADTPPALQLGKYLLLAAIIVFLALNVIHAEGRRAAISEPHKLLAMTMLVVGAIAITKGVIVGETRLTTFGLIVLPGAVLLAAGLRWTVSFARLSRIAVWAAAVYIAVEAIQLALFYGTGRLPALAYEGSTSVRFGSLIDDPNGMGILVALMAPVVWIAARDRRLVRFVGVAALLVTLFMTQSFTAMGAFVGAILIGGMALVWRSAGRTLALCVGFGIAAVIAYNVALQNSYLADILTSKSGSIAARGIQLRTIELGFDSFIGIGDPSVFVESSYLGVLVGVGLLPTLAFFGMGIFAATRYHRRITAGERTPIMYGLYFFVIVYLIGSVNLRLDDVYPVNVLYIIAICLSVALPADDKMPLPAQTKKSRTRRGNSVRYGWS